MSRILVVGANGTVGSELSRLLAAQGESVVKATSRTATGRRRLACARSGSPGDRGAAMTPRAKNAIVGFAVAMLAALPAAADDGAVVRAFYERILSHPGATDLAQRIDAVLAPDWVTLGNNTGGNDRAYFTKAIQGFGQAVPNLKWEIQEILVSGNRYVVRGRATGTPAQPVLGVDPAGRSFDVMSIDIHTVENGRIVRSFHIEDWAGAIRQLRSQ